MRRYHRFACVRFALLAQNAPVETAWDLLAKGKRNEAVAVLRQTSKPILATARLGFSWAAFSRKTAQRQKRSSN